ncbi:hypothetical protein ElyMa_006667700 [Elysia marginata]|uniref:Uncharacterized protein n=1 Tax=Elysia marginata TaxID=1093978 RepID=A0AAV4IN71_9GAST|nr:hypothetical protein ElyMa_006667700 [Elysia marginata]
MADNIPLKQIQGSPQNKKTEVKKSLYNAKIENFNATEEWRKEWENDCSTDGSIITNPTQPLPGFTTLKRKQWVITNRLRTRHAKTAYTMHKWKLKGSLKCQRRSKVPASATMQ